MAKGTLEHVNLTVSDPLKTAEMVCKLFGWHIRWQGPAMAGAGYTVHVGDGDTYLAVYGQGDRQDVDVASYQQIAGLNHVGVVVDDLDDVEAKVVDMGMTPVNHGDYGPGKRFYFHDHDGVEFEVVSYG
ncbi:MAG: VOC family protein [Pseudomonadota bacterium]